ncbi:MAG: aminopeptidase, partial [Myxococcales bacterium]|nr:aminopeptidase [Myxococcales bacterium]
TQRKRLEASSVAKTPQYIITPEEARQQSLQQAQGTKTWIFGANQVRDFAFAASNTFIWDAMAYRPQNRDSIMAMSFYPPEAKVLWERYSTHAVIHTLEQYERFTFPYPYPVAISVNGPIFGMEYPMITFNGVRPKLDGTYSKGAKYALIGVIIHEVGHFFFPMIVNSDERQWTWLDEGINSFLQYQAERAWEKDYPSWNGAPDKMIPYMTSKDQMPIMTNSESLIQFGNNAYGKPATALSVLRETVMGPELFDEAFKAYAQRWRFKRPMPSDFFRTLEDVSGVDLDWFWSAWFYSTAHVDVQVKDLRRLRIKTKDPKQDKVIDRMRDEAKAKYIAEIRDESRIFRVNSYPELADFYNSFDPHVVTEDEIDAAKKARKALHKEHPERAKELETKAYFYELSLVNKGGVVTPLPLLLKYKNKQSELRYIPAEIWRKNSKEIKVFLDLESELESIEFDPFHETGDAHKEDNVFPQRISDKDSFDLKTWRRPKGLNPMQKRRKWLAKKKAATKAEVSTSAQEEVSTSAKAEVSTSAKEEVSTSAKAEVSTSAKSETNTEVQAEVPAELKAKLPNAVKVKLQAPVIEKEKEQAPTRAIPKTKLDSKSE